MTGLILIGFVLSIKKRSKALSLVLGLALLILFISSIPVCSNLFLISLENAHPVQLTKDYPNADAIVVLGGTTAPVDGPRLEPEERDGSRLLPAVRLYKNRKAPLIVVSGGVPYLSHSNETRTESLDMKDILVVMGVPESSILMENRSRNTIENALYTAEILKMNKAKSILLVTSAFHMKRSVNLFKRQGFSVFAVPTEHRQIAQFYPHHFFPKAGSLRETTLVIKEWVGYLNNLLFLK